MVVGPAADKNHRIICLNQRSIRELRMRIDDFEHFVPQKRTGTSIVRDIYTYPFQPNLWKIFCYVLIYTAFKNTFISAPKTDGRHFADTKSVYFFSNTF